MSRGTRVLAVAGLTLAIACGWAAPGRAEDKITLITTGKGSPLEWPVFIGLQNGSFKAAGIGIDMLSAASTAAAMQQVTAGSGDMGSGGLTDPIHAIDHGAGLSVLMLQTSKPPYSVWAKPAIKTIADLRGKLVIVGGAKDITRIYFEKMALPNGLKPGDYDLTYAGTTPARYAALLSGAVDAAMLYPPAIFRAAEAGYSKLGELSDYVTDLPFTGYAVNVAWAKAHEATVKSFFSVMRENVHWFYDPANREKAVDILAKESNAARGDVEKTYDYFINLHIYPEPAMITPNILSGLVTILKASGDLDGAPDPKRFIDADLEAAFGPGK